MECKPPPDGHGDVPDYLEYTMLWLYWKWRQTAVIILKSWNFFTCSDNSAYAWLCICLNQSWLRLSWHSWSVSEICLNGSMPLPRGPCSTCIHYSMHPATLMLDFHHMVRLASDWPRYRLPVWLDFLTCREWKPWGNSDTWSGRSAPYLPFSSCMSFSSELLNKFSVASVSKWCVLRPLPLQQSGKPYLSNLVSKLKKQQSQVTSTKMPKMLCTCTCATQQDSVCSKELCGNPGIWAFTITSGLFYSWRNGSIVPWNYINIL